MAKLWQFSQGHPKPAFPEKVQREDEGKFFKNRLKSSPRLNGQKHSAVRGIIPTLKVQGLEEILVQKTAPKVPEQRSYGNFCKVTLNLHFLKKCKEGTKKNFSKITKKKPSFERPKRTLAQMALS